MRVLASTPTGKSQFDVTVRGAGVFGLATGWSCARRGAKVRVVDPNGPGAGSSGGLVGALAPHTPERWEPKKAFQLDSLLMAERYWAEIEATGGVSPDYARTGRLQPIKDANLLALSHERAEDAKTLWQGKAIWSVVAADQFPNWAPLTPTGFLVFDTLTARMAPRRAAAALVAAIRAKGGEIVTEAPDEGRVIWATGWRGLLALSDELGTPVGNGVKGQSVLLKHPAPDMPQIFADGVHIIPHADETVAIGSTSERYFDTPDTCDAQIDAVLARARAVCPALANAPVLEHWAGVRPRAKTRAPMLGEHPTKPGQFIANGGFKIGFGMAPKVGEIMADLILDGQDHIPEDFGVAANL